MANRGYKAYSNANTYEEYLEEVQAIDAMLSKLGLEKRFTRRSKTVDGQTVYYFTDLDTHKDYTNLYDAKKAVEAAGRDFRSHSTSRQRNVDPNASPVTVSRGSRVGRSNDGYSNANMYKTGQLRNEYSTKIKQYNQRRGATVLALCRNASESKVYVYVNPNGAYLECDTFEDAKSLADQNVIVVNGKPWDKNGYNYASHSAESKIITDFICHCLMDDDFMSTPISNFR